MPHLQFLSRSGHDLTPPALPMVGQPPGFWRAADAKKPTEVGFFAGAD